MSKFVKFTCPNRPVLGSDFECRASLGGVSVDVLIAHDFSKGPWVDLRRCEKCGYIEIALETCDGAPKYRMVGVEEKIDWVRDRDFFGFIHTYGRRLK